MTDKLLQLVKLSNSASRFLFNNKMITRSQIASFSSNSIDILHDRTNNRFTTELNGNLAVLDYDINGSTITFLHTEVPDVFRGKGVGKILAQKAFDHADKNKYNVKIECDFVNKYYTDNKEKYPGIKIK